MSKVTTITISGKVQGVGFREAAKQEAGKLGINGYIENKGNGDVYLELEGEEEKVSTMIRWCRIGPPKSRVKEIYFNELDPKNYSSFEIKS